MDDELLLKRFLKGDSAAIHELYRKAYPTCARFIKWNTGTEEDAKDFFQDALMVLHHNARKPQFTLSASLTTYLYSIVRNKWLKKLRKDKHQGPGSSIEDTHQDLVQISDEDLHFQYQKEERLQQVEGALDELGEECRELILDYYYGKMKLKEIAEQLALSEKYVRLKKFRCMDRLVKIIKERLNTENKTA